MSYTQHTPGPWNFRLMSNHGGETINGTINAETKENEYRPANPFIALTAHIENGEVEANTRLITAAPKLLEALLLFVQQYEGNGHDDRELRPEMQAARAALAIVRGE